MRLDLCHLKQFLSRQSVHGEFGIAAPEGHLKGRRRGALVLGIAWHCLASDSTTCALAPTELLNSPQVSVPSAERVSAKVDKGVLPLGLVHNGIPTRPKRLERLEPGGP